MPKNIKFSPNDLEEMKKAAESGTIDDFINERLSPEQSSKVKELLQNKELVDKLLASKEAQGLLNKFMKGK